MFGGFKTGVTLFKKMKIKYADPNFDDFTNLAAQTELLKSNYGVMVCLTLNTVEQRKSFCQSSIGEEQIQGCLDKFCEVCCFIYDIGQTAMHCKNECNANTAKTKINIDEYFMQCYKVDAGSNDVEK